MSGLRRLVAPTVPTAAPGTNNAQAASTAYADATAALGGGLTVFTPERYGAKGDRRDFADGAITSGQATLNSTTAAFTSADAGKTIRINSAGAAGAHLVTTISSVSGGVATLATTAGATVSSAACGSFGTDDTAAIQSAITAAMAVNGIVKFLSPGYVCAGALQATSTYNSVLTIPQVGTGGSLTDPTPQGSLTLRGAGGYGGGGYYVNASLARPPRAGTVIEFFAVGTGTDPSGLAAGPAAAGFGVAGFNWIHLTVEDLQFRTAPNQGLIALNVGAANAVSIRRVGCDKNAPSNNASFVVPSNTKDTGIMLPQNNNGASQLVEDVGIDGYYYGAYWQEHCVGLNLNLFHCTVGLYVQPANHASQIGRACFQCCKTNMLVSNGGIHNIVIEEFDTERDAAPWAIVNDIQDQGSLKGSIKFKITTTGGANKNLITDGAWYVNCRELEFYRIGAAVDGDTFPHGDRSTGTIGPDCQGRNYYYVGSWNIVTNRAQCSTGGASPSYCTIDRYRPNGRVGVTLQTVGTGSAGVVIAHAWGSTNGDGYLADGITGNLYRRVGGASTSVGTFTPCVSGDRIELEKHGKLLTVYVNGASVATYTDSSPLTGLAAGMFTINSTGTYFSELVYGG